MDATLISGQTGTPTTDQPHARPGLRQPKAYLGYVGLSAMDALCTGAILALGGVEVNPIADAVLARFGFGGMVAFKFALVALVIVCCEQIIRHRPRTARAVMGLAIGITAVPITVAAVEFVCLALSPG